jgi:hypothetical protein
LWNGTDGIAPPPWLNNTFDATHSHYLATQAAQIDSDDLEAGYRTITEHGYGLKENGQQLLVFCHYDESVLIQSFQANEPSRTGGPDARFSFIPSIAAPPYLSPDFLIGTPAPSTFGGLDVVGSYGPGYIIESSYISFGVRRHRCDGRAGKPGQRFEFRAASEPELPESPIDSRSEYFLSDNRIVLSPFVRDRCSAPGRGCGSASDHRHQLHGTAEISVRASVRLR